MREHAKSNDVLESVRDGMVSLGILSGALSMVWNVSKDNGVTIVFLELSQLILKPLKLISSIIESGPSFKVIYVTDV